MTTIVSSREARGAGQFPAPPGLIGVAVLIAASVAGPSLAGAQAVIWSGGVDVTTGDYYFSERTTAAWLVNEIDVRHGVVWAYANLPLVAQNSDVVTRVAGQPVPTGGKHSGDVAGRGNGDGAGPGSAGASAIPGTANASMAGRQTIVVEEPGSFEVQVADPMFGAGVDLAPAGSPFRSVRFGVSAKAPIRDVASGVGTGEWDVGLEAGISLAAGSVLILADGAWWSLGDLPDLELRNMLAYSLALGGLFGDGAVGWSLSVDGSTPMIENVEAPIAVGGDLFFWSARGRSLRAGIRFGLTESAPDLAGSVGWVIPFRS